MCEHNEIAIVNVTFVSQTMQNLNNHMTFSFSDNTKS